LCASIIDKYLNWQNIYEYLSLGKFVAYYNIKTKKLSKCPKQRIIRFVNHNKHKDMENWSKKNFFYIHDFKIMKIYY